MRKTECKLEIDLFPPFHPWSDKKCSRNHRQTIEQESPLPPPPPLQRIACKILYKSIKTHHNSIKAGKTRATTWLTKFVLVQKSKDIYFYSSNTILPKAITNNHIVIILLALCLCVCILINRVKVKKRTKYEETKPSQKKQEKSTKPFSILSFISSIRSYLALFLCMWWNVKTKKTATTKHLDGSYLLKFIEPLMPKAMAIQQHKMLNYSSVQKILRNRFAFVSFVSK